jgi:hypothetical protein
MNSTTPEPAPAGGNTLGSTKTFFSTRGADIGACAGRGAGKRTTTQSRENRRVAARKRHRYFAPCLRSHRDTKSARNSRVFSARNFSFFNGPSARFRTGQSADHSREFIVHASLISEKVKIFAVLRSRDPLRVLTSSWVARMRRRAYLLPAHGFAQDRPRCDDNSFLLIPLLDLVIGPSMACSTSARSQNGSSLQESGFAVDLHLVLIHSRRVRWLAWL